MERQPVSAIVVNYNGKSILDRCLSALSNELNDPQDEIIVADNGSTDGSQQIAKSFNARVLQLQGQYGAAFTYGAKAAKNNYLLMVQNDQIVSKNFLKPLFSLMDNDVFAVSPKFFNLDHKTINYAYSSLDFVFGFFKVRRDGVGNLDSDYFNVPKLILYPGMASLVDKKKFLEIDGMDMELYYPATWEDVDLGYCAWKRGWKTIYQPKSVVFHEHTGSLSRSLGAYKNKVLLSRNKQLFFIKNISSKKLLAKYIVSLPFIIIGGTLSSGTSYIRGFLSAMRLVGMALRKKQTAEKNREKTDYEIIAASDGKILF
jgi:GT2 family glycosyltransferase